MKTLMCFHIVVLLTLVNQPASSVFVENGRNVQLVVAGYETCKKVIAQTDVEFAWKFNKSTNVVRKTITETLIFPKYENRVRFSEENLSLLLENIQERDSGNYTAVLSGEKDINIVEYQISVQVRVDPPVLAVDSSTTNGTCNVKVTCRSQNTTVTSSCNSCTCSPVGVESSGVDTSSVSLLSVYVTEGTIICNHSNQVSWANDTKKIVELCPMKWVSPPAGGLSMCMLKIILQSVGLVAMITAVITVHIRERFYKQDKIECKYE